MQLADVLLEVEVPAESFVAVFAREGLLLVVRVHVECEVVDLKYENNDMIFCSLIL